MENRSDAGTSSLPGAAEWPSAQLLRPAIRITAQQGGDCAFAAIVAERLAAALAKRTAFCVAGSVDDGPYRHPGPRRDAPPTEQRRGLHCIVGSAVVAVDGQSAASAPSLHVVLEIADARDGLVLESIEARSPLARGRGEHAVAACVESLQRDLIARFAGR